MDSSVQNVRLMVRFGFKPLQSTTVTWLVFINLNMSATIVLSLPREPVVYNNMETSTSPSEAFYLNTSVIYVLPIQEPGLPRVTSANIEKIITDWLAILNFLHWGCVEGSWLLNANAYNHKFRLFTGLHTQKNCNTHIDMHLCNFEVWEELGRVEVVLPSLIRLKSFPFVHRNPSARPNCPHVRYCPRF